MAHTFGGVAFHTEQQEGTSVPVILPEAILATEHIAGGNLDVTQHLGMSGTQEVALPIVVTADNWSAFAALVGQSTTLALIGNPSRAATLKKPTNIRYFAHEGLYKLNATFLVSV